MSNIVQPPSAAALDPEEYDEETQLRQKNLDELFESDVNLGLSLLSITAIGVIIAWNTNVLKLTKTPHIFLTVYNALGFFCFLMAKLFHQGMKFKIFMVVGMWMHSSFVLTCLTEMWPRFQLFVLAVTAFTVVVPYIFLMRLHSQTMDARKWKRQALEEKVAESILKVDLKVV